MNIEFVDELYITDNKIILLMHNSLENEGIDYIIETGGNILDGKEVNFNFWGWSFTKIAH
jgi:hypothetical protein